MNKRIFITADWIAFIIVPLVLGIAYLSGNGHLYKERGSISLNLLYLLLFMKPVIVILGYRRGYQLLPYRRQLGIIAVWLALGHTIGLIVERNLWDISYYLSNPLSNYLLIGMVATLGMILLGMTSNFFAQKLLKKNRKRIQRLSYPVLFLSKLHADLSHTGRGAVSNSTAISIGKIIPTLLLLVVFIGLKYRQSQIQSKHRKSVKEYLSFTPASGENI